VPRFILEESVMKMRLSAFLMSLASLVATTVATAASIHVKPTTVNLGPGQSAATITISNEGDKPLNAQVRVFGWDQQQNKDVLGPTDKLVASPPATTLAAGQSQSIRLVRVDKTAPTSEETYRLVVDEIPDKTDVTQVGVAVQMRYSLPVFVMPKAGMKKADLTVTAQVSGNALTVSAQNRGEVHAQAANVSVVYAGNVAVPVVNGLLGYVLPGKSMQWTVNLPADIMAKGKPMGVTATFNGQPFNVNL
jgi:fimbrial chaperone protein